MSKTVFDHLTESIDQVVKGRRYIIAEIGKVKTDIDEVRDLIVKSSGGNDMAAMVNDLKGFTQKTLQTLTELKSTVGQLSGVVKNLQSQVTNLQMRGAGSPQPAAQPMYQQQPAAQPMYQQPPAAQPMYQQPQATPQATPQAAPPAGGGISGAAASAAFDKVLQAARSGTPAKDIGGMLDSIRTALAKANPLNPTLFELSMEAGRLKSLGGAPLDPANQGGLDQKIQKWKSKC